MSRAKKKKISSQLSIKKYLARLHKLCNTVCKIYYRNMAAQKKYKSKYFRKIRIKKCFK